MKILLVALNAKARHAHERTPEISMKKINALFFAAISAAALAADPDVYEKKLTKDEPSDKALLLAGFSTNISDEKKKKFELSYKDLINSYDIGAEIDGKDQPKSFYKKLDVFIAENETAFPVDFLIERKMTDVRIGPKCKNKISENFKGFEEDEIKIVNDISSVLMKKCQIYAGSNAERAKQYFKYALAFSMVNDSSSAYRGANFQFIKSSNAVKHESSESKQLDLLFIKNGDNRLKLISYYNHFQRNLDLLICDDLKKDTHTKHNLDDLSKSASEIKSKILDANSGIGVPIAWDYIRLLWLARNYGTTHNDKEVVKMSESILKEIGDRHYYAFVRRWAKEALMDENKTSTVPKRIWPGKTLRNKPEGLFMDMNGDNKVLLPYNPKDFDF